MSTYTTTTYLKTFNANRTYNTTSKPTLAYVASHIPKVSGEMNARFSAVGITTPITTSPTHDAYLYVNYICANKCACIAERSALMGGSKQQSENITIMCKEYEDRMKAIEANPKILTSLIDGGSGAVLDSYEYSNSDERRDTEPFIRSETQW